MSDIVRRLVALANSLGGTEEENIMAGVAEIERLRAELAAKPQDPHGWMMAEIERLRAIIGDTVPLEESAIGRDRAVAVENERLRAHIRAQAEDIMTLGQQVGRLEVELAAERERCARIAEGYADNRSATFDAFCQRIAAAIRRGDEK